VDSLEGDAVIVVVDYGLGNLAAVVNMLDHLGFEAEISRDPSKITRAKRLILPGVGAFDASMRNLRSLDLIRPLEDAVLGKKTPVLGVCLGMQLLGKSSEEGTEPGLGWIDMHAVRIMPGENASLKVPHIGWSDVNVTRPSLLFNPNIPNHRFYFVHSYHVQCANQANVAGTCNYGDEICCAVANGNIYGVQFHAEKSHRFGMELFRRFVGDI
jgi:glutamine amidotransferase